MLFWFNKQFINILYKYSVGLPESSPFNPLKVLDSLLETSYQEDSLNVSVIGIFDQRLDFSESNRALLVQVFVFQFSVSLMVRSR